MDKFKFNMPTSMSVASRPAVIRPCAKCQNLTMYLGLMGLQLSFVCKTQVTLATLELLDASMLCHVSAISCARHEALVALFTVILVSSHVSLYVSPQAIFPSHFLQAYWTLVEDTFEPMFLRVW